MVLHRGGFRRVEKEWRRRLLVYRGWVELGRKKPRVSSRFLRARMATSLVDGESSVLTTVTRIFWGGFRYGTRKGSSKNSQG